jgi:hypothetical protein
MSPEEVEILAVERKLVSIDKESRTLWRELAAIRQGLMEAGSLISQAAVAGPVSGHVTGCNGRGVPAAPVTITLASDGSVLATGLTDSGGAYSWTPTVGAGTPIQVASSFDRLGSGSVSATVQAAPVTAPTIALAAQSGYHCYASCATPLAATLSGTDSLYGDFTLSWNGIRWQGVHTVNYAGVGLFNGGGPCAPVANLPLTYILVPSTGAFVVQYPSVSTNPLAGCPRIGGTATGFVNLTLTSSRIACPPGFLLTGVPESTGFGPRLYGNDPSIYTVTLHE